jgi:hypothetical protein
VPVNLTTAADVPDAPGTPSIQQGGTVRDQLCLFPERMMRSVCVYASHLGLMCCGWCVSIASCACSLNVRCVLCVCVHHTLACSPYV